MKMLKKALVMLLIFAIAFSLRQFMIKREEAINKESIAGSRQKPIAKNVDETNEILVYFKENFPEKEVVLACEEDLNNDSNIDLLVIYKFDGHVRIQAICKNEDGYYVTPEIPAPVENQTIQFFNMDKKDEMEFILSGEKAGQVGYGIFRLIDGELKDLFGDGMNECC